MNIVCTAIRVKIVHTKPKGEDIYQKLSIGTQQLDFPDNFQCKSNLRVTTPLLQYCIMCS